MESSAKKYLDSELKPLFQDMTMGQIAMDSDEITESVIEAQEAVVAIPQAWSRAVHATGLDNLDESNLPHRAASDKLEELKSKVVRWTMKNGANNDTRRLMNAITGLQVKLDDENVFNGIFGNLEPST